MTRDQMAALLGCRTGGVVSRHEHFRQAPSLESLITYQVVLGVGLDTLFPTLYRNVQTAVADRARVLQTLTTLKATARGRQTIDLLTNLVTTNESPLSQ